MENRWLLADIASTHDICLRCFAFALRLGFDAEGVDPVLRAVEVMEGCSGPSLGTPCGYCRRQHHGVGDCVFAPRELRATVRSLLGRLADGDLTLVEAEGRTLLGRCRAAHRASGLVPSRGGPSETQVVARLGEEVAELRDEVRALRDVITSAGLTVPNRRDRRFGRASGTR